MEQMEVEMEPSLYSLARSIRMGLAKKYMKQSELAQVMGVRPQYVHAICAGSKIVGLERMQWLAEYFDVPLSTFILWGE
jgi:transcriptional regulator with XRE-family HTH domain